MITLFVGCKHDPRMFEHFWEAPKSTFLYMAIIGMQLKWIKHFIVLNYYYYWNFESRISVVQRIELMLNVKIKRELDWIDQRFGAFICSRTIFTYYNIMFSKIPFGVFSGVKPTIGSSTTYKNLIKCIFIYQIGTIRYVFDSTRVGNACDQKVLDLKVLK